MQIPNLQVERWPIFGGLVGRHEEYQLEPSIAVHKATRKSLICQKSCTAIVKIIKWHLHVSIADNEELPDWARSSIMLEVNHNPA